MINNAEKINQNSNKFGTIDHKKEGLSRINNYMENLNRVN